MGRDELVARFENIGDKFDHYDGVGVMQLDIVSFMYSLYFEANHEKDPFGGKSIPKDKTLR